MNRLMIVDDQREVRDEIEGMLLEMDFGFDMILHADCAREAILQIQKYEPAIILLDIVMPGDDGFVVAEYIHNKRLHCEIMIMTAFPQFDFVLKAVECRIAAFLIKPIQKEKLQHELLEVLKESRYEQQKQLNLRQHSHLYFRMLDVYMSSETSDMSFDVISANTGLDDIQSDCMAILVTDIKQTDPVNEKLYELSRLFFDLNLPSVYYVHADNTFVFIAGVDKEISPSRLGEISERIRRCFQHFTTGMSLQPKEISLRSIYQQATFALDYARRLLVDNSIVLYNSINIAHALFQKHKDDIYAAFIQNNESTVENAIDALFIDLNRNKVAAQPACDQWILTFRDTRLAMKQMDVQTTSLNQLRANLISHAKSQMELSSEVPHRVAQIIQYVSEHYHKHLNLTYVSNELNINYSYASTVFKKHTGSSFTDYLTRYRLAKAAELLENTNCYIYEVAGKVGFEEDNKNFYRLFKQTYGLTPSKYRMIRCGEVFTCESSG